MLPGFIPVFNTAVSTGGNDAFTKLLLHCDGTPGSTSFPDSSASNHTVTVNGTAVVSNAQVKFGNGALAIDGSAGCYIHTDGGSDFAFGSGDFTVDFWGYFLAMGTAELYDSRPLSTPSGLYPTIYLNAATLRYFTNGADAIIGGAPSINTWHHIALARAGTNTKLFLDGVQTGPTYTDSNVYLNGATRPFVGGSGVDGTGNPDAYFDEIRVSKGIARWTANFTPPTVAYF